MTKSEKQEAAKVVLSELDKIGVKVKLSGKWLTYEGKIPTELFMRILEVDQEMVKILSCK